VFLILFLGLVGIVISVVSLIFAIKTTKEDCTTVPFIVITVLGGVGIFFGMGFIAGGLVLAGGIVGIIHVSNVDKKKQFVKKKR